MSDLVKKFLESQQKGPKFEEVELPSLGRYYGSNKWSKVSLPGGKLKIRAWTIEEEKILNTQRYLRANKAIDMIFDRCCEFPEGFTADDLLIGDRAYLLFAFRGISYGNIYEFSVTCTNEDCAISSPHEYDLNELSSQVVWAKNDRAMEEPVRVKLPDASAQLDADFSVGFRFQRQHDLKSIELKNKSRNYGKGGRKGGVDTGPDDAIVRELFQSVVEVDGESDKNLIKGVIENLSLADLSYLRRQITELTPGVVPEITIECPHCGNKMDLDLPITESFFRFTGRRDDRGHLGVSTGRNIHSDEAPTSDV